jgi:hypothetical protein
MTKKRRTKFEKIRANRRQELSEFSITSLAPTEVITPKSPEIQSTSHVSEAKSYSYVMLDIKKTMIIISALVTLNAILYLFLKLRFINIPGLGF